MASHSFSHVFYDFAFMLLCYSVLIQSLYVTGDITGSQRNIINISSLLPQTECSSPKAINGSGARLKLIHQHGPCSPFNHSNKLTNNQILTHDQSRVNFINQHRRRSTITTSTPKATTLPSSPIAASKIPAHTGNSFSTGNYIITISFGTPEQELTVIFDTGSDVTWIQCQPCSTSCYSQQEPLFDPSQSTTFSSVSCSDPACSQLYSPDCSNNTCVYTVKYGDKSHTSGLYSKDTLTLSPSDTLTGFFFGCGENNSDGFGKVAGLLGLGRGLMSLISQSNTKYNGVFSYCLPSTSSSTGYLTFGGGGAPANLKNTKMLTDSSMATFYFLGLQSISVDGTQLSISPTVFSNVGTIIDSGTVISRLPQEAYSSLRDAFRQKMSNYPEAQGDNLLDTCYDLSSYETVEIPTVSLEFADGLVLDLDASEILFFLNGRSQACLGFAGNEDASDVGIIGNTQQRKFSVVYDVPNQVIGFGQGGCD
ncbi:Aspartic peptidase A1 family protein [Dioscorea alata]|uniref:Aspartic peptidase A1 family protein n=1 Tax=Dioscorea alata TaxID=55571 RepID=A0ACB7WLR6_DIOAL|nr:Aspartic peptidase A1 family protein [Dioscorea alata]